MVNLLIGPAVALLIVIPLFIASAIRNLARRGRGGGAGAVGVEELHALLYPAKRIQMDERQAQAMLRDDEADGAPKRMGIDLDAGVARIRRTGAGGS
jgi:hypothetical protein